MNIYPTLFVFSCLVVSTLPAAEVNSVAEDYIWQERYKGRMELARGGDAEAQFNIGEMFEKGSGVHADLIKAFTWYEQAANQNHQKAQFKVAYMYYRGDGVTANPAKAFQLMIPLAKYGYVRAQYYLALMYETGAGTTRNMEQAQLWYSRAAVGGYAPAEQALADNKRFPIQQRAPLEIARTEQANTPSKTASNIKSPAPADTRLTENIPSNLSSPITKNDPIATALRNEAARGAQIALGLNASNMIHIPMPPSTAVAGLQPIIQMQPTTYSILANGNWVSQLNMPVEFLPSKLTTCEPSNETAIECTSKELVRAIGDSEIGYLTQATVYAVQPSGEFKVTYRNNIVKINRRRESKTATEPVGIKLGLQDTEHHLECKLENEWSIQCVKNQTQKITLTKQTAELKN
ncbi:MAG: sel1 repeat family protein [Gammaproteobacteria bacterium]|nr:sel1 repeat family protein [Gammaproteobacteria bacterium]